MTDIDTMTLGQVGFAGDWHGNTAWAGHCVGAFANAGISRVFHLGDFGLWPGEDGKRYLQGLHDACDAAELTLFVTLGNHEDYDRVSRMRTDDSGWLYMDDYPLFRFAPRGHVWRSEGVLYASLGGAGSVDMRHRTPGKSWWPQEAITAEDVAALSANLEAVGGGRVDVMLTHDAPAGLIRRGMMPRPSWITEEVEAYCWQGRVLLAEACDIAQPRSLLHGHWHDWYEDDFEGDGYQVKVWGLPEDGKVRNCVTASPEAGAGVAKVRPAFF
jgi:hypothetical protein